MKRAGKLELYCWAALAAVCSPVARTDSAVVEVEVEVKEEAEVKAEAEAKVEAEAEVEAEDVLVGMSGTATTGRLSWREVPESPP